jgi:hypothetical protein
MITYDAFSDIAGKSMLMSWCHGRVGTVSRPDMGTMKDHSTVSCESRLTSEQNVSYRVWVYNAFCEKSLAKHHPCTIVMSEAFHSLETVRVKWLLMEISPDKGVPGSYSSFLNTRTSQKVAYFSAATDFRIRVDCNLFKWIPHPHIYCTKNSVVLVRKRTIPTERPQPVGEVSANFSW